MSKLLRFTVLILVILSFGTLYAQKTDSFNGTGFGIEGGANYSDNAGDQEWGPRGRANFQYQLARPLITQFGVGYSQIKGSDDVVDYTSDNVMADLRFMVNPFPMKKVFPYLYAGIGVSRNINTSSDYMAMVPVGIGVQTRIASRMLLTVSGGYTLAISDDLDGIDRMDNDKNRFTDSKHDGYFEANIGLNFTKASKAKKKAKPVPVDQKLLDSDGDGLSDWDEINVYGTDPFNKDTDGDGLSDGDEVLKYKTDPLNKDTDGDGLSDGDEVLKYKTDPLKKDTDGDGLTDGDEVLIYKTDPLKWDTDGDGLSDGDEVLIHKTNPLKWDTDGGGMSDGAEVKLGLNPLDPADDLFELIKGEKTIMYDVTFKTDRAEILPESKADFEKLQKSLDAYPNANIVLIGHADSRGEADYNQKLSVRRAQAVKNWLVKNKIDGKRITVEGRGATDPIARNDTPEGQAKNRRIDFLIK